MTNVAIQNEVMKRTETIHDETLIRLITDMFRAEREADYYTRRFDRAAEPTPLFAEARDRAVEALGLTRDRLAKHEEAYTNWSRFWLVTSSDGHIHRNRWCSTCRPRTAFALLPELSGLDESEAVEAYGSILCSVCFPSAPVEWTTGEAKAKTAAKEKRAAEKAAREAKRLEKALLPDGSPLALKHDYAITTVYAAKAWLTSGAGWHWDHPSYTLDDRALVLDALSAKLGETPEKLLADAEKRAKVRGW